MLKYELMCMTVKELKSLAKDKNVDKYSSMKREELVAVLEEVKKESVNFPPELVDKIMYATKDLRLCRVFATEFTYKKVVSNVLKEAKEKWQVNHTQDKNVLMQEISRISEEERQLKIDKYHTGVLQWNMKVVETLMDLGYDLSFEKLMKVFEKIYTTAKLSKALSTQTAAGIRYLTKEIEDL